MEVNVERSRQRGYTEKDIDKGDGRGNERKEVNKERCRGGNKMEKTVKRACRVNFCFSRRKITLKYLL